MFYHDHRKEPCGRYTSKPEIKTDKEEVEVEEAEPLQQKVENLRTKIVLQERYNAALKDNLTETSTGNFSLLRDMFAEVLNLRMALKDAVGKEKRAVHDALRTHRFFQLALKRYPPPAAIDWMDDKLFDNAKILNEHIERLIQKRKRLEGSEEAVSMLEQWPIPGSLPWEMEMEEKMEAVTVATADMKTKLECAKVLNGKYKAIRVRLRDERNLYERILRNLNTQLSFQLNELSKLEKMLWHAKRFEKDAETMLEFTEKDASTSRKVRRGQISRMRREMQRIVQEEQLSLQGKSDTGKSRPEVRNDSLRAEQKQLRNTGFHNESWLLMEDDQGQLHERLAQKRAIIETFNENAAMLVDVMKIPNLTHIPQRMNTVLGLTNMLEEEKKSKEMLKSNLIKQRDQLMQLLNVIQYTGHGRRVENDLIIKDYQSTLDAVVKESVFKQENILNEDSSLLMDIQMAISGLTERMEGLDKKPPRIANTEELMNMLPVFSDKLETFVTSLETLKKEIPSWMQDTTTPVHGRRHTHQRQAALLQHVPGRYIRAPDAVDVDEISDEEEYDDFKVPGRLELKMRSEAIVEQALLRLGISGEKRKSRKRSSGAGESTPGSMNTPPPRMSP